MSELARVEAEQRGLLCVIRLHGEVDISNDKEVLAAIEMAVPHSALRLIVDLTHTTYLDSAGLALLLRLAERLQARRQQMVIVAPVGSPVRTVLELTGLPRVIPLEARLEDAVRESEPGIRDGGT
ncbi:MAG TPA: STAS domain-containing protein [Actinomycetota bacterium]|nr:STAS domain-containing protein [Actinomycetota bacterium]